jgi:hypothetical protein
VWFNFKCTLKTCGEWNASWFNAYTAKYYDS